MQRSGGFQSSSPFSAPRRLLTLTSGFLRLLAAEVIAAFSPDLPLCSHFSSVKTDSQVDGLGSPTLIITPPPQRWLNSAPPTIVEDLIPVIPLSRDTHRDLAPLPESRPTETAHKPSTALCSLHSQDSAMDPVSLFCLLTAQQRTSLAVQWLRLPLPMQRVQVRSLVGEPRSHMPHDQNTKT